MTADAWQAFSLVLAERFAEELLLEGGIEKKNVRAIQAGELRSRLQASSVDCYESMNRIGQIPFFDRK